MLKFINYPAVAPEGLEAMLSLEGYVRSSGIGIDLLELVKTRVSQINGCAYCVDMHTKEAITNGETGQRLHLLQVWRDAPLFSTRERAALAWAEALTEISTKALPHGLLEETLISFSEKELVDLTLAIIAINGWNRLSTPFRAPVGSYQPAKTST